VNALGHGHTQPRTRPPRWDAVALGEVMLRLDPGEGRIATTRSFRVWEGGAEYNVARALRRCFGLRTALLLAFVDNPVGRLLEDLILQGGVDTSNVRWLPFDGIGRAARNGLNFTERGFGIRNALGCSDRGHTAASQMVPGDLDYDRVFGDDPRRYVHGHAGRGSARDEGRVCPGRALAAFRPPAGAREIDEDHRRERTQSGQ
jgi:hypothetical protein